MAMIGDIRVVETVDIALTGGIGLVLSAPGGVFVKTAEVHGSSDASLDRTVKADV
jgi:hypothetical protein